MNTRIHPTALIEDNVSIGDGTAVWDNVHIRHSTTIGEECIVGEKTYIAYGVTIGNRVKLNAFVYICNAVTIEDGGVAFQLRLKKPVTVLADGRMHWFPAESYETKASAKLVAIPKLAAHVYQIIALKNPVLQENPF